MRLATQRLVGVSNAPGGISRSPWNGVKAVSGREIAFAFAIRRAIRVAGGIGVEGFNCNICYDYLLLQMQREGLVQLLKLLFREG